MFSFLGSLLTRASVISSVFLPLPCSLQHLGKGHKEHFYKFIYIPKHLFSVLTDGRLFVELYAGKSFGLGFWLSTSWVHIEKSYLCVHCLWLFSSSQASDDLRWDWSCLLVFLDANSCFQSRNSCFNSSMCFCNLRKIHLSSLFVRFRYSPSFLLPTTAGDLFIVPLWGLSILKIETLKTSY